MASKRRKRRISLPKRTSKQLTPRQRQTRGKSLEALSLVRREKYSLTEASRQVDVDPKTVRRNTGAFYKRQDRWRAKTFDKIPRFMWIYEKGRKVSVEIASSRTASLIGEYHNIIKQFLNTGKSSHLRKLRKKTFRDIKGRKHTLETHPKIILRIKRRESKPEFFQIYRR